MAIVRAYPGGVVEHTPRERHRDERARGPRTLARDDDGAVARLNKRPVQDAQDLLGAAGRIGTDRSEGVCYAENREGHGVTAGSNASARRACPASSSHCAP